MKFAIQYLPLDQIKPGAAVKWNAKSKALRQTAWDCMHLLVVRKNKGGGYTVLVGNDRYEQLRKHSRRTQVPCLVDGRSAPDRLQGWWDRLRKPKLPFPVPDLSRDRVEPAAWSIIRSFMKQEPRFRRLTRKQQLRVLMLGIRYKRTTVASMKRKVDDLLK
ncbi:hypothetical protein [Gorillibacterium sp. sgz5001074]|uniref:hypothetical protein n=1 Tax=Gorillibacterium sp. sgz5001074 TaxID=3446695 RepID=UPI003F678B92